MCLSYRSITDKPVKVNKPHRCGWCAHTIVKRDKAQARTYVFDGEFQSDWMHPECYEAMGRSDREAVCEGWMPGDFERGEAAL